MFANLPVAQALHMEDPLTFAKLPAKQEMQLVVEFDSSLNLPGAQAVHSDRPDAAPNDPATQAPHSEIPMPLAKLPASHGAQRLVEPIFPL
jgi:hypothetical protein